MAIGALVPLDTTPVVPAPTRSSRRPLDLLTRVTHAAPQGARSRSETLSPSRYVVNPEVLLANASRDGVHSR